MKIHSNFTQNSLEWLQARAGVITASEADNLVTPKWKVRDGKMVDSYLAQKLAEKWTGSPVAGFMTLDMEAGRILEEEAIPWIEFELGATVARPALITDRDGAIGCSPDGMIGDIGLEIKCPGAPNHVKYLLAGELPEDYFAQVQFSMLVTGCKQWRFLSYNRRFPKLILTIDRDEKAMEAISEAVDGFIQRLDEGYKFLVEKNGGEPKRYAAPLPQPPAEERFDILN